MLTNVAKTMDDAVAGIPDGATIMIGGFGSGIPYNLIAALHRQGAKDLTVITVNATAMNRTDVGFLKRDGRIKTLITQAGDGRHTGIPQGTLVERIRAGAAGVPAFYTPTGVGTLLAEGKEHRDFNGRTYLLETALTADYALIPAWRADTFGNLQFEYTQRTINPTMARAARKTMVEVEDIVEGGDLDPNFIHCPGVFVSQVVKIPPEPDGFHGRPLNIAGVPTRSRLATRGV